MKTISAIAILLLSSVAAFAQTSTDSGLILVPINPGVVSGANGTQWATTLWAYNSERLPIAVNCAQLGEPVTTCPTIPPITAQALQPPPYAAGHPGYFMQAQEIQSGAFIPLSANHLWLDLRSVDSATAPSSAGVQIPLPRVDEFSTGAVRFAHIPLNGHSRLKLRVYAMRDYRLDVLVFGLVPAVTGRQDVLQKDMLLHEELLPLLGSVPGKVPSYAELDLPAPDTFPAITVELRGNSPGDVFFWAFVTVTDSQSEQVTIMTPRSPVEVTPTGSAG